MMTVPFESKRSLNSNSLTRERWSFGTIVHHFLCWLSKYSCNSLHQHLIFQFIDLSCGEQYKFALSSSFMLETNLGLVHFRDRVSSVQLISRVRLFGIPWTAACQASLSIINSQSLLKLMPIESVIPSNHLILCYPLLLLASIFPNMSLFQ